MRLVRRAKTCLTTPLKFVTCNASPYEFWAVIIRNIIHKGLRRFVQFDDARGLQPATIEKLRRVILFLQDMKDESELKAVPTWKAHRLSGDRGSTWSLFITKNWRLTFAIDKDSIEIIDLNYEDYH